MAGTGDIEGQGHSPRPNIEAETAKIAIEHTTQLEKRIDQGGLGEIGNQQMAARARAIIETVHDNPDRVIADATKPPQARTEWDPAKAFAVATTIDAEMTFIAKDEAKRQRKGRTDRPWSNKRARAELSRRQWSQVAANMYDQNPDMPHNLPLSTKQLSKPWWKFWA